VVQILLFGIMAIELKRRAPRAHTVLELVRKRWGHVANWVRLPMLQLPHACICFIFTWSASEAVVVSHGCALSRLHLLGMEGQYLSYFEYQGLEEFTQSACSGSVGLLRLW
jgi:hypothetical protein